MWAEFSFSRNRTIFISLLLAGLLWAGQVHAAPFTWDGGGTTNNWNDAVNWSTNIAPVNDGSADIIFGGALRLTPNAEAPYSILSLSFNSTASPFTIGGSPLTIGAGGIINVDADQQSIASNLVLTAPQTWSAAFGPLFFGGTITSTVNMGANALTVNGNFSSTISSAISGTSGFTKDGTGTVSFLGNPNTYSGTTTVLGGTLILNKGGPNAIPGNLIIGDSAGTDMVFYSSSNQIADTSSVTINPAGVLDLGTSSDAIGSLTITGGQVTGVTSGTLTLAAGGITTNASATTASINLGNLDLGGATKTLSVADGAAANDLDISSRILGLGLIKTGPGTLRLAGPTGNSYSGATTVNDGTLLLAKTAGVAINGSSLIIGDGAGSDIVRLAASNQIQTATALTINSSGLLDLDTNSQTIGIQATLSGGAILIGPGGILRIGAPIVSQASAQTATISGAGSVDLNNGARTFNTNDGAALDDMEISTTILGGGSFTKIGAGRLVFSGTTSNTYTGPTNVQDGTLVLRKTAGQNAVPGNLNIGDGAGTSDTLRLGDHNQIADTATVFVGANATFDLAGFDETITQLVLTSSQVTPNGGTLTLAGDVTVNGNGGSAITAGTLNLQGSAKTFNVSDGLAANDLDISAILSNGSLVKNSPGTLRLSGSSPNIHSNTIVNAGTLVLAKTPGINAIPGGLTISIGSGPAFVRLEQNEQIADTSTLAIAPAGQLDLNGHLETIGALIFSGGGGTITTAAGTLTLAGDVTSTPGASQNLISGNLDIGAAPRTFNVDHGTASPDLLISGSITGSLLEKQGLGDLRISANNTAAVRLRAGTLSLASPTALGSGQLSLISGTLMLLSNTTFNGPVIMGGDTSIDGPGSLTLNGPIADATPGAASLYKTGPGTLNLGPAATLGTLLIVTEGTVAASTLTVDTTGRFDMLGGAFNGTLINNGLFSYQGGAFAGSLINNLSFSLLSMNIPGGFSNNSPIFTLNNGLTLTVGGTGLQNSGQITLDGGTFNLSAASSNNAGITGHGAITGSGSFTNNGIITLQGGNITLNSASQINNGNIDLASGLQLLIGTGALTNRATINLNGGVISGSQALNNTASGTVAGRGTILNLFSNAGLLLISGGATNVAQPFSSTGTIQLAGAGSSLIGGKITSSGTIQGAGAVGSDLDSSGTIEPLGGTLIFSGLVNNSGTISAAAGNKVLFSGGLASNSAIINLTGGTFDNAGFSLNNTGQISGYGTFRASSFTNNGTMTFTGGQNTINGNVTNAASHQIRVAYNPALFTGTVTNNGIFKNTSTTVTFSGLYIENGTFISDPADNFFGNVNIGEHGAWIGGRGDRFFISGDFLNSSTKKSAWQTNDAELRFTGGADHLISILGQDLGRIFEGYENNFSWGILTLGAGDRLSLQGDGGALYLRELILPGGLAQISNILGNGHSIYYDLANPTNSYLNGKTYLLAGGGTISPVPEPASVVVLIFASALLLAKRRRRNHHLLEMP